jgi:hypothetical protein
MQSRVNEHIKRRTKKKGLRIYGKHGHPEVRVCLIRFAKWLRKEYEFPVRLNVYLFPNHLIASKLDGDKKYFGTIWFPDSHEEYLYIRIATGDYEERKKQDGRDNALASDICMLCRSIIKYWQWLETNDFWDRGVGRKATKMLRLYNQTTDHP